MKNTDAKVQDPGQVAGVCNHHECKQELIVVEEELANRLWDMVPAKGKLDETMWYTSIHILKVNQRHTDRFLVPLGIFQSFHEGLGVLDTSCHHF